MALQRVAGIANLFVNNVLLNLRGNFTVSSSTVERTMLAGQDTIHGYQELPRVPWIEGDLTTMPQLYMASLIAGVGIDVSCTLASGMHYKLINATCKAQLEQNTRDGQVRVRWEGTDCVETYAGFGPIATTAQQ
jgi:hypothetical protein